MSTLRKDAERFYEVIKRPLVTEKSNSIVTDGQYTFEVLKDATKIEIKRALELIFPGRKVLEVRTLRMLSHQKRVGSKIGRTQSSKKAIVKIEGEPLEEITGA